MRTDDEFHHYCSLPTTYPQTRFDFTRELVDPCAERVVRQSGALHPLQITHEPLVPRPYEREVGERLQVVRRPRRKSHEDFLPAPLPAPPAATTTAAAAATAARPTTPAAEVFLRPIAVVYRASSSSRGKGTGTTSTNGELSPAGHEAVCAGVGGGAVRCRSRGRLVYGGVTSTVEHVPCGWSFLEALRDDIARATRRGIFCGLLLYA